jgi:uncharacterized protein (DUF302 family)
MTYHMTRTVDRPYDATVQRVKDALAAEGFGVLTEIDVRATLKKKLDVDFPSYVILGACNPPLAHRALSTERAIGVLLPCNVAVYATGPSTTVVSAINPEASIARAGVVALAPVAEEVKERLSRALAAVAA